MVVGSIYRCDFESRSGEVYSIQHYVIKFVSDWWLSPDNPVSSTNKTDCHDITEILLKVALTNITLTPNHSSSIYNSFQIHIFQSVDNYFS